MNSWARRQQGFTIVELLIVVVVIAILAAIVIVAYNGIQDQTRQSAAKESLSTASKKIQTSFIQHDTLPASLASLGITDTPTVSYQYTANTSFVPNTYCVTTTSGKYSYHIASNGTQTDGPCPGHTGEAPKKLDCAPGFVTVPGNSLFGTQAFCVMKYEAKESSGTAVSTAASVPWTSVTQAQARTYSAGACTGCHLLTLNEWLTIAHNLMNVDSNWSGGNVGSGSIYTGHNDNVPASRIAANTSDSEGYHGTQNSSGNQRRTLTLSNGEIIWDIAGNVWEWVDETVEGAGNQPGLMSDDKDSNNDGTYDYAYKKWTTANIQKGIYAKVFPGYGSAQAAANSWNDAQGLGELITNYNHPAERGFIMGGAYTTGYINAGLFTLRLNNTPFQVSSTTGFRAAYTP